MIESGGEIIQAAHLHLLPIVPVTPLTAEPRRKPLAPLPLNLAEAEEVLIQRALDETNGNIAEAARLLGVNRTRIYRKLAQEEPAESRR